MEFSWAVLIGLRCFSLNIAISLRITVTGDVHNPTELWCELHVYYTAWYIDLADGLFKPKKRCLDGLTDWLMGGEQVMRWYQGASPRCSSWVQPREEHREEAVVSTGGRDTKEGFMGAAWDGDIGNPCHGCPQRNEDGALQNGLLYWPRQER